MTTTNLEKELSDRKCLSLKDWQEHSQLLEQRKKHQKTHNLDTLPDWSDHCTPQYLQNMELMYKFNQK